MSERPDINETRPQTTKEHKPHDAAVDPELAYKLGKLATRPPVEDPARTARAARLQRGVGEVTVRAAQRSEPRTSGRDRPPSPENRERS